jgi:hypothetical protein
LRMRVGKAARVRAQSFTLEAAAASLIELYTSPRVTRR